MTRDEVLAQVSQDLRQQDEDEASGRVIPVYPNLPLYMPLPTRPGEVLVEIRPRLTLLQTSRRRRT